MRGLFSLDFLICKAVGLKNSIVLPSFRIPQSMFVRRGSFGLCLPYRHHSQELVLCFIPLALKTLPEWLKDAIHSPEVLKCSLSLPLSPVFPITSTPMRKQVNSVLKKWALTFVKQCDICYIKRPHQSNNPEKWTTLYFLIYF